MAYRNANGAGLADDASRVARGKKTRIITTGLCLACEGFFSGLAAVAVLQFLMPRWDGIGPAVVAVALGAAVFALALYTLVWQGPIRGAISAFARQSGEDPADLVFWLWGPRAIVMLVESVGVALVVRGFHASALPGVLCWGWLQVLVLAPPALEIAWAWQRRPGARGPVESNKRV